VVNDFFYTVIPAKAGIQFSLFLLKSITNKNWIPAFAGMTRILLPNGVVE